MTQQTSSFQKHLILVILLWGAVSCSDAKEDDGGSQDSDADTGDDSSSSSRSDEDPQDSDDKDTGDPADDSDTPEPGDSDTGSHGEDSETATPPDSDTGSREEGSDTSPPSDSDTDSVVELPDGSPIADVGIADLISDRTAALSPRTGLPSLEGLDPAVSPALAGQSLPGDGETIHELQEVAACGNTDAATLGTRLRADGVVRIPTGRDLMSETLAALSSTAAYNGAPGVFVTSDAVFHTFHNYFDNVLLGLEIRVLRPNLLAMLSAVKVEAAKRYNALPDGDTKAAALDMVAYLQVAESLMDPEAPVIAEVAETVAKEVTLIHEHGGYIASPIFDRVDHSEGVCSDCNPCNNEEGCELPDNAGLCPERFCEDYSQYVPRGHYTYSEEMEHYFRSVMWLGRITLFNRSHQSTRGAVVLLDSLKSAEVEVNGRTVPALDLWRQFFRLIGTIVGSMDDLNVVEYDDAVTRAVEADFSLSDLDDDTLLASIHQEIDNLRDPRILMGGLDIAAADVARETKGLRLLGQVFLPDSFAHTQLMPPHVGPNPDADHYEAARDACGIAADADPQALTVDQHNCICQTAFHRDNQWWEVCRTSPSGLDIAAGLGHAKAASLAVAQNGSFARYETQLNEIAAGFGGFDLSEWASSLSWTWLYALKGLFEDVAPGMPAFMRTDAWENKTLETGLASWAEMRHDTILYAKQAAYGDADGDVDPDPEEDYDFDYLEPQPKVYSRLDAAAKRLGALIEGDNVFGQDTVALVTNLSRLSSLLQRATDISIKEIQGETLDDADIAWIQGAGSWSFSLEWQLLEDLGLMGADEAPDTERLKTTLIADVYTFGPKASVLEVGSGYVDYVVILHQLPTGQWGTAIGPAFTYHELGHPMANRLTDEAWRAMLEGDADCGRPAWLTPR